MEGVRMSDLKNFKRKVFDFDGTITITRIAGKKERLFKLLVIPYLAYTLLFLARPIPNEDLISVLRQIQRNKKYKKKYKLLIASSRPYFFKGFLKRWLLKHGIDCPVICLWRFRGSLTEIKLEFIKDIEADEYIENNENIRERFRKNKVKVSSSDSFCEKFRKKIKIKSS